ncbi:MAG: HNH endonuclease [Pseudomonadota bacterium]
MAETRKSKFKLKRLTNYSDEALLNELKRVAQLANNESLTKKFFNQESRIHASTIIRRFGGWKEGLNRAGLVHLYEGRSITQKMRQQKGRSLTDEELLNELRRISKQLGRKDLVVADINKYSVVGKNIFKTRFGTWKRALEKAGLTVRPQSKRYTDEECFENLFQVWKHYGRQPSFSEINRPPSAVGGQAYILRFKTWMHALEAFVERVNSDNEASNSVTEVSSSPALQDGKWKKSRRSVRTIPLGLRFQVLRRDRFMCVACGRNPPQNPGCILHIDHIIPWSKNGKTEINNLRTLCEQCNIGRSNKYTD